VDTKIAAEVLLLDDDVDEVQVRSAVIASDFPLEPSATNICYEVTIIVLIFDATTQQEADDAIGVVEEAISDGTVTEKLEFTIVLAPMTQFQQNFINDAAVEASVSRINALPTQCKCNCWTSNPGCNQVCGVGCDQRNMLNALCLGGGCNQQEATNPQCDGGGCDQQNAFNARCAGGFCKQQKSTDTQCAGGSCHQQQATNPECLGGGCNQDGAMNARCGQGQCSQRGISNAQCAGGGCCWDSNTTGSCPLNTCTATAAACSMFPATVL